MSFSWCLIHHEIWLHLKVEQTWVSRQRFHFRINYLLAGMAQKYLTQIQSLRVCFKITFSSTTIKDCHRNENKVFHYVEAWKLHFPWTEVCRLSFNELVKLLNYCGRSIFYDVRSRSLISDQYKTLSVEWSADKCHTRQAWLLLHITWQSTRQLGLPWTHLERLLSRCQR